MNIKYMCVFFPSVTSDHSSSTTNVLCEKVNATRFAVYDDFFIKSKSYTAWDSEIESLTSLNSSLTWLDCRKTRRRHRVTAALAPRKSCFLPCNANLHAISASLKHGLPPPSFFE